MKFKAEFIVAILFLVYLFLPVSKVRADSLICLNQGWGASGSTATIHASFIGEPAGAPMPHTINWGDGQTNSGQFNGGSAQNAARVHTYNAPGQYTAVWSLQNQLGENCELFYNIVIEGVTPTNGRCSDPPIHYNCAAGTLGASAEYPDANNPNFFAYQWWCNGSNGGTDQLCTESKSPPSAGTIRVTSNRNTSWAVSGPQDFFGSGTSATYSTTNFGGYGISVADINCFNKSVSPGSMNVTSGSDQTFTITYTDNGSCPVVVPGCTDPLAFNYNASATQDDGSCTYRYACNGSNQCVKNPSGSFTSSTCNGACAPVGSCAATHYNCSSGTAINGSDNPTNWSWLCRDVGGDASCTEQKTPSCAATHYNCSSGTAINGSETSTNYTWLCRISGAADASCTEPKPTNGTCSNPAAHYTCASGSLGATAEYPDANNPNFFAYQWWCNGSNGGTNQLCTEPKTPPSAIVRVHSNIPNTWVLLKNGGQVGPLNSGSDSSYTTNDFGDYGVSAETNFCFNGRKYLWNNNPSVNVQAGEDETMTLTYTDNGPCTFACSGADSETRSCSKSNACFSTTGTDTRTRTCVDTSTNPGTWGAWSAWSCSAAEPSPLPAGYGTACTGPASAPNACGMTNPGGPGTVQCSGACSGTTGVTPPDGSCPAPTTSSVTESDPDYCQSGPGGFVAWTYSDPNNSPQSAYQVQISDTGNFNSPMYDSGQINSGSHVFAIPPGILQFNTTYRARVRTWNTFTAVSAWSNPTSSWKTPIYAYPNIRPPSQFTWPTMPKPQQNQSIQFTDHAVFGGGTANNRQWSWNFGDGTTSTQQNPAHTYPNVGNYTVTETVTDAASQTCSYSQPINIQKPIPVIKEVAPR